MSLQIRPVEDADYDQILAIWGPIVRDTAVTFASVEKTAETLDTYVTARRAAGRAFLVAARGAAILGFATYDQFRGGDGYRFAMEHSVFLGPDARGAGIGRQLMGAIEDHARGAGAHTMMAGISGENPDGVAFHTAIGYAHVGLIPQSGHKFGRWMDLVLMQKIL